MILRTYIKAVHAKTAFSDNIRPLSIYPDIGDVYGNLAKIMAAMAGPTGVIPGADGDLRVNWTDGSTAGVVNTTTFVHGSTPGSVGDTKVYEWALLAGVAEVSPQSQTDYQKQAQTQMALHGIHQLWADDLIDGAGTDHTLMGFDTQITNAEATPLGAGYFSVSGLEAVTVDLVTEATAILETNDGVIFTNVTGYRRLLKYALAAAGGAYPTHIAMSNLGFGNVPEIMGMPILIDRHITDVGNDTFAYVVNTGPEGAKVIVPDNQGMFEVRGPIYDQANVLANYHILMRSQVIYPTPRGVVKIAITTS